LTASARVGVGNLLVGAEESLRRGRTKESPKQESKSARKKTLAFVAAIRERKDGAPQGAEQKD
jgi:hypothetical protein